MEPHPERIREELAEPRHLNTDETPLPVGGSASSHARVAAGDGCMHVTVACTRDGAALDVHCRFFSAQLTCDGYGVLWV